MAWCVTIDSGATRTSPLLAPWTAQRFGSRLSAAPSREPLELCLRSPGESVPLAIIPSPPPSPLLPAPSSDQRLVEALTASRAPLRLSPLREPVGLRHQTVSHPLANLIRRGVVQSTDAGYLLAVKPPD